MMDKLASDAYSQGAYDALESMNIPQHIKVAAAQYMTKEALAMPAPVTSALSKLKSIQLPQSVQNAAARAKGVFQSGKGMSPDQLKQLRQDQAIAAALGLTTAGTGAYALGAFDEDEPVLEQDLMSRIQRGELNRELAMGAAGLGALGAGAYALS